MNEEADDMAADRSDDEDDELLRDLRRMLNHLDPVPPEVVAAARASFIWHTIDTELAGLVHDSVLDRDERAMVRGVEAPVLLTFEAPGLVVEVETVAAGGARRVLGQLTPGRPAAVEVRHRGGTMEVTADELGRFSAEGVAAGPVSLRCRTADAVVDTDWFIA